jgi:hypothetical protein
VNSGIDFLSALEDLVDIQVLFCVIHHLQNDAPLPGQANATLGHRLL